MDENATPAPPPLLYDVAEATAVLHCSRTTLFAMLRTGELASIKIGRKRLVPREACVELVARLQAASQPRADAA